MNNPVGTLPIADSNSPAITAALGAWELGTMLTVMAGAVLFVTALLGSRLPALTPDTPSHTRWIDGLRGAAATLVVLNHGPLVLDSLSIAPLNFSLGETDKTLMIQLGRIGVHLFFCITGFLFAGKLMNAAHIDWSGFFVQRLRRLVPAYAAAVAAAVGVVAVFARPDGAFLVDAARALPNMLSFGLYSLPHIGDFDTGKLLGMNWTLAYEWQFYALLPLMFALVRAVPLPAGLGIVGLTLAFSLVAGPGVWVFFAVGALAAPLARSEPPAWLRMALRIGLAVVLASMVLHWQKAAHSQAVQGLHISALFFLLVLLRPAGLTLRPLVAAGTISYSLYIFHLMVLYLVVGLCHRFLFDVAALSVPAFTALLGATAALAALWSTFTYMMVERPFLRPSRYSEAVARHRPALQQREG